MLKIKTEIQNPQSKTRNILIVDDMEGNLILLEALLTEFGYNVVSAINGKDALEKLHAEKEYDLIISDVLMPVMDGFMLCKNVKKDEKLKNIPLAFYTASYTDEKDEVFALKLGADKFIRKPIGPDEFLKIVQGLLKDVDNGEIKPQEIVLEGDKKLFRLYNERLVDKLEKKVLALESEIIERKKIENALKESEEKYRKLLETAKDAIVCDINGTITVWNRSAEKLFGYLKDEIIGKPIEILIPEEYKKAHQTGLSNFIKTGVGDIVDKKRIEVSRITKEGVEIPIELSLTAQKIEKEQYFFMSVIRDLTEQKRSQRALKASEHKYRTLVQTIPAIVYKIDTDGRFIYTNDSIRKLGYEPEDLRGKHFSKIIQQEDFSLCNRFDILPRYANKVIDVKETPKLFDERRTGVRMTENLEVRLVPKSRNRGNSEIPVVVGSVTSSGDYDDESREFSGTVGIIMDITEKTKLLSESIRSSQLAAVGELAAGVAHEINNPINTIINTGQLLLDESSDKEINFSDVNVIIEESVHIANIVRSLLSFVRDKKDERANSNVFSLVTEILVLTEKQMKDSGIKVKVGIPEDLPDIFVCRQRIQQVFLNILNNSHYALDERYPDPNKEKVIEISGKMTTINGTRYIQIMFHDRGIGIPANMINKVMIPFITTKPLNNGTGLGLSISNTIINEHSGKMEIESTEGESTKVVISLPVTALQA